MWFDSWNDVGRILLVGTAAYLALIVVLRVAGKRTLAKLNAFDFTVTVAFGSTLAAILLDTSVSWTEGVVALALLAALQLTVAWSGARVPALRTVVTSRPTYLVRDGVVLDDALRRQRVTVTEINQAVRGTGQGSLAAVAAVVLETDGTLSVIGADERGDGSALDDVQQSGSQPTAHRHRPQQ